MSSFNGGSATVIHWFRQDLRLADNPALADAAACGDVLPVYILDDDAAGDDRMGAASRWWLHRSLAALNDSLDGRLVLARGDAATLLPQLASQLNVTAVTWNDCYEPWRIAQDDVIEAALGDLGCRVIRHHGSRLWQPGSITKDDGRPYRVFTPFYKAALARGAIPRRPLAAPAPGVFVSSASVTIDCSLAALELAPTIRWDDGLIERWQPGEDAATAQLSEFVEARLVDYAEGRDRPATDSTSSLSPYLHFGELSPNQVWYTATDCEAGELAAPFLRELSWREFCYSLLAQWPDMRTRALDQRFERFPWRDDEQAFKAWCEGRTGHPLVDAGMRELWRTGFMHNRVRMIAASFLVKNLLIDWRRGEQWFWDCLVDADHANNAANWQWVAGCGADAAPYIRIFNPATQGERFDPDGLYTRRWVPEVAALSNKYLYKPWAAPGDMFAAQHNGDVNAYPSPVADLRDSRARALATFKSL